MLKQNFLFNFEKLVEYRGSAVNVVWSNPCVGTLPRIKISFFLLLICTDELISSPKIMTFLRTNEYSERESYPIS